MQKKMNDFIFMVCHVEVGGQLVNYGSEDTEEGGDEQNP